MAACIASRYRCGHIQAVESRFRYYHQATLIYVVENMYLHMIHVCLKRSKLLLATQEIHQQACWVNLTPDFLQYDLLGLDLPLHPQGLSINVAQLAQALL